VRKPAGLRLDTKGVGNNPSGSIITFYGIHGGRVIRTADILEPVVLEDGQVSIPKRHSASHIAGSWRPVTHIRVEATNMLGRLTGNWRDPCILLRNHFADSFADSNGIVGGPIPCRAM
jgi:hypothetical protein